MLLAASGPGTSVYRLFLFLHIATAIVGFGSVTLNGLYASKALRRSGAEGAAVSEVNYEVGKVAELSIYAVFVFGLIVGILGNNHGLKFSQGWLSIAILLYIVAIGISHGVLIPTHRKLNEALRTGARSAIDPLYKRAGAAGGTLNLILAVILFLMVFKPGGPKF
jgi:uncharacterized membrane protein